MLPGVTLEGTLRAVLAGKRGLTLYQAADGRWQCSVLQPDRSWNVTVDADPAEAVRRGLLASL